MKVVYHPAVQRDVSRILRHYDGINDRLGDEFWEELNSFINKAAANPTSSPGAVRRTGGIGRRGQVASQPCGENPREWQLTIAMPPYVSQT